MTTLDPLFPNFDTLIRTPEDVARLNETILQLAVQGKLVPQDPADEPASELLKRIRAEKRQLVKEGKLRAEKPLPKVESSDVPYELPEDWEWVRMATISKDIQYGYTASADFAIGGCRLLRITDIQTDRVDWERVPGCAIEQTEMQKYLLQENDILIARTGGTVGKSYLVQELKLAAVFASYLIRIAPPPGIEAYYLKLFLGSPLYWGQLNAQSKGTGQPNVNGVSLGNLLVPLPPLAEQRRIVAKVESLFAQTRALGAKLRQAQADIVTINRAALNRLSAAADAGALAAAWRTVADAFDLLYDDPRNVAELRQAILQLAVQGKLTPQDPNDEPASELLKRIRAEKRRLVTEGKLREEKSLPPIASRYIPHQLPKGWSWGHFLDIANIATESTDPGKFPDLPHIAPDNIEKSTGRLLGYQTVSEDGVRSVNHHFHPGQILYSKIRPNLSKAVVVEFEGLCSADMYPIEALIDGHYLLRYILSRTFLQMVTKADTRVAMPKVNQDQLSRVLVAIPPLAEQHRIVAKVDQLMRLCDALEAGLAQAEELRRTLTAIANCSIGS